jgi:hypothetical protein
MDMEKVFPETKEDPMDLLKGFSGIEMGSNNKYVRTNWQ